MQFEFIAKAGYNLSVVKLYNPLAGYALLEEGLSATEEYVTIYRVTTTISGIVYMTASTSSGYPTYRGYVNLDAPAANGFSEVYDTYAGAAGAVAAGEPQQAHDLSSASRAFGPKRVKTPNLEVEQFDPLMIQRARDREGSVYPTFGSFGWTVVSPNPQKYKAYTKNE